VLLNRDLITVAEESIRLLSDQLKDQENRFAAGTVPRFNVLQAEVALANAQPNLIRAKNDYLISKLQLAKILGFDSGESVSAIGELRAVYRELNLARALEVARGRRPLLKAQKNSIDASKEQITVAAAGYKPRLEAGVGYEIRNSRLTTNLGYETNGWFLGVNGSWNFFDGLATKGRLDQARAQLESAKVTYADTIRQVDLEVQTAYAGVDQAKELIASQVKVVEQADETLRLARERLNAGAGTQLDVLAAQVALTQARTTQKQALSDYNVAIAEFDRAVGAETIADDTVPSLAASRSKASLRGGKPALRPRD
jgi:outer membrane protein TolC